MVTIFNGATSTSQHLCGGGPQGSLLIVLLFCIQVNMAGEPCPRIIDIPSDISNTIGPQFQDSPLVNTLPCHEEKRTSKKIYIDDLTILEAIDLRQTLTAIDPDFIGPQDYHSRCGLSLPQNQSILQHKLEDIHQFTVDNMMMVNKKKTMIMPFNFTKMGYLTVRS